MKKDTLPKSIIQKMTVTEHKKLEALEKKREHLLEKMLLVQGKATEAIRKDMKQGLVANSATTQRLINDGFKAEIITMHASDNLRTFKETLRKKYSSV